MRNYCKLLLSVLRLTLLKSKKGMIHRGEVVERAIRQSGMAITEVAKRMGRSRRHLYNIFEDPNIPTTTVLQIGKIIHHDFTRELPDLDVQFIEQELNELEGEYQKSNTVSFWQNKYLALLEKYNTLLEELHSGQK